MLDTLRKFPVSLQRDQVIASSILAVCSLAAFMAYSLGFPGDFVLDDFVRLPGIEPANAGFSELVKETLQNLHGLLGRPFSVFTISLTKATSGNVPEVFKYQNILLHLITGLLQFWGLAYLLGALSSGTPGGSREACVPNWIPAACITAVWLVHPLFVSTVLYSIQRIAVLAALFTWAAITCYVVGRHLLSRERTVAASALLFIGVPLSMAFGIASKENAVLVPVYLLLINYFIRLPNSRGTPASRVASLATALLIVIPILMGGIYLVTHVQELLSSYAFRPFSLPERILTQGYLLWWYGSILFFPLLRRMSIYHDGQWVVGIENIPAYLALLSLVAVGVIALALRRRAPVVAFGVCLFLASHALESTIFPLELVFEHRNYVGASGLFVAAYGILAAIRTPQPQMLRRKALLVGMPLIIVTLSVLLAMRAWSWSDGRKLVMLALQEQPHSLRAHVDAANYALRDQQPGRAASILRRATTIDPANAGPFLHLHTLKCEGTLSEEIIQANRRAARTKRITPYAADGFQKIAYLAKSDRCPNISIDESIALHRLGLDNPTLRSQYRYRLNLRLADLYSYKGAYEKALEYSAKAREQMPEMPLKHQPDALVTDARISLEAGNIERLMADLTRLEELMKHPYLRFAYPHLVDQTSQQLESFSNGSPRSTP